MKSEIEIILEDKIVEAIRSLFGADAARNSIQIQNTKKEFNGDFTVVVFPLLRLSKKGPEETSEMIGKYLIDNVEEVDSFNVVKGFLNLELKQDFWTSVFTRIYSKSEFRHIPISIEEAPYLVEYSSPNTNKPLHLGHIRNNLLGYSVSKILEASGSRVIKTNIVNDRGIHICKSMLAWKKWGEGETPASSSMKGDHLVGKYYVKFEKEYRNQIDDLVKQGIEKNKAEKNAPLIEEAQAMLLDWEKGEEEVLDVWKMMNGWVYEGFSTTYKNLGVDFDVIYYESETFKLGRDIVEEGLKNGVLFKKEDGSIWADLADEGLDEKLLLRSDGTAVYMTQDLGTAVQRFNDYHFKEHVYVVGNEQNYHFQVLKLILKKLGYDWSDHLYHLSYGMVELPEGKMKSREGKVVDADDLIDEMIITARDMSNELGKLDGYSEEEKKDIYRKVGLGALKYFILKVDPKKNMTFDPRESVDFNGNTGPFIQYTYARIKSVLRKAEQRLLEWKEGSFAGIDLSEKEIELVKLIRQYKLIVNEAAKNYSPALIANYIYDLVKEYNQFYHDFSILREENERSRLFRLQLSEMTGRVIKSGMELLGIEVPERM